MNYCIFVLGYDLLHDVLNGIECDVAYDFCYELYADFVDSTYNNIHLSTYMCLSNYVNIHMTEIKEKLEGLR